jgi:hypothetical protein
MIRRLKASADEQASEDVHQLTRGNLVHASVAAFVADTLDFDVGLERDVTDPANLASSGLEPEVLMGKLLSCVADQAPWLERSDAIAAHRRLDLVGLSRQEWAAWLDDPTPQPLRGRLGHILSSELELSGSTLIAVEWPLGAEGADSVRLSLPDSGLDPIDLVGLIDRVEVFDVRINDDTLDSGDAGFVEPLGARTLDSDDVAFAVDSEQPVTGWEVTPLDIDLDMQQSPPLRRAIIIRDLKTMEGPDPKQKGLRHRRALIEELQLALYARAWELTHPGDRVVAVGVSEVGEETVHLLEADPQWRDQLEASSVGVLTDHCGLLFRRPDEDADAVQSNPFRAWMRERLTTALQVATAAAAGRVSPTPERSICSWCKVADACGLAAAVGGDRRWS